ncbi:hypothetical protein Rsub_11241 [Raphidocelis subcapitata]|uniref:Uncharacterized protein n=1 Tax=Raphidocelis subcapitata TaxID=307507 RepID=A0A2V0PLW4_9CHLO|nr:hypothetical protein Rsub_11241 [Raphidocelis subcapitata]|eukprot:GBF98347.1 hypothetical protein Rsub_11241 [Raphidocelis subcapitata]
MTSEARRGRELRCAAAARTRAPHGTPLRAPRPLAAALCVLLAAAAAAAAGDPITIDSSVILLYAGDVEGGGGSECAQMARRAMEGGGRTVNFVVTGYYRTDGADRLVDLGFKASQRDRQLRPFTADAAARFGAGLADCMRLAASRGFGLAVHVHLDDGGGGGTWRNALQFDPFTQYGQLSYWEALVRPAALAVRAANVAKAPALLSLQAEMGATLFYYPRSYLAMARQVRALIAEGGTPPAAVRVGVNLNWEKVCGCPGDLMQSTNYYSDLRRRWNDVRAAVSVPDVQALFRAVDWIGVSAYAPLPLAPRAADLEASLRRADGELRLFGLDLRGLGKELVFSEFGVGGGAASDYQTPARDASAAAAAPFWGVDGRYAAARDPWASPASRDFRRAVYRAAVDFAEAGGGPDYKVSAIYTWNLVSFDATGVHYCSASDEGSYRDPVIAEAIRAHNEAARARGRGGAGAAASPAPAPAPAPPGKEAGRQDRELAGAPSPAPAPAPSPVPAPAPASGRPPNLSG